MRRIEAKVAMCNCSKYHKKFGIRFEEITSNTWAATWAFEIKNNSAHREGYDNNMISGDLGNDENYPGCPFCKSTALVLCSCGRLSDDDVPEGEYTTCEWCGRSDQVVINTEGWNIKSSTDR